jgi:hypothetical protein
MKTSFSPARVVQNFRGLALLNSAANRRMVRIPSAVPAVDVSDSMRARKQAQSKTGNLRGICMDQYTAEPPHCPICGSIDIVAGRCQHCGSPAEIEIEIQEEN